MIKQIAVSSIVDSGVVVNTIVVLDDDGQMWTTKNNGKEWKPVILPSEKHAD